MFFEYFQCFLFGIFLLINSFQVRFVQSNSRTVRIWSLIFALRRISARSSLVLYWTVSFPRPSNLPFVQFNLFSSEHFFCFLHLGRVIFSILPPIFCLFGCWWCSFLQDLSNFITSSCCYYYLQLVFPHYYLCLH